MKKPLTTLFIVRKNLVKKPFRTAGLSLVVLIFSFLFFAGSVLTESVRSGICNMSERLGADMMVVPYGYDKHLQSALLRGEPSSFYLSQSLEEKIKKTDGVEKVSSQIFIASLQAACCSLPVQLIGFDPGSDFVISPWMKNRISRELQDDEIIVGSKIEGETGGYLTFFGKKYRIAMRLDRTGMGFDTSVFLTLNSARNMIRKLEIAPLFDVRNLDQVVSSIMVKAKSGQDTKLLANTILQNHAIEFNLDMMMSQNMVSDIASHLRLFSIGIYGFGVVLWIFATGILMLVFAIVLNERKQEFSLFRVLGASKKRLSKILLAESFLVSLTGTVLGLFLSALIVFPFYTLIGTVVGLPFLFPGILKTILIFLVSFIISVGIGPLASLYSIYKLRHSDLNLSLRGA